MTDQITNCTLQNDAGGSPKSYMVTYLFDGGATGLTKPQDIFVDATSLDDPSDVSQAIISANAVAVNVKNSWLQTINLPVPVNISSVIGPVVLE